MEKEHIVFGANGGLGLAIVRELRKLGLPVKAVVRSKHNLCAELLNSKQVELVDALSRADVINVCEKAEVIYNCINVPYSKWSKVMPTVVDNIITAAAMSKAKIVFPGNVYGYGPFQNIPATENHPQVATSKKGKIRIGLEKKHLDAQAKGDIKVVIPRFPDYYGPNVTNKLMAPIFKAAIKGKKASWLGKLDVTHDLIFIEDAAKACLLLAATDSCYGESWHVTGAGSLTGQSFLEMIFKAANTEPKISVLGRGFFRFIGFFAPEAKELIELMYEFEEPLVLDDQKFMKKFPSFKQSSHEVAIKKTVEWFRKN